MHPEILVALVAFATLGLFWAVLPDGGLRVKA